MKKLNFFSKSNQTFCFYVYISKQIFTCSTQLDNSEAMMFLLRCINVVLLTYNKKLFAGWLFYWNLLSQSYIPGWPVETSCLISNSYWLTSFYRCTIFVRSCLMLLAFKTKQALFGMPLLGYFFCLNLLSKLPSTISFQCSLSIETSNFIFSAHQMFAFYIEATFDRIVL